MTKLLEEAIEKVRALSEADQDTVAEILIALASKRRESVRLDGPTRAAVREGAAQASRGEFVSEQDMAALFKRLGA